MSWKRQPGSSRRYVNTDTGASISYRQYRSLYELSEQYHPLDLPQLARQRKSQRNYNALVATRHKAEVARKLAQLDTSNMGLIEAAKAERAAIRSVSKRAILTSADFKEARLTLKKLRHVPEARRTPEQNVAIFHALETLGKFDGLTQEERFKYLYAGRKKAMGFQYQARLDRDAA